MDDRRTLGAELEATIEARKDLDPAYEPALVESFLDRIDEQVQRRVDGAVAEQQHRMQARRPDPGPTLALAIVSLGTGVPITAIAADQGVAGLVVAWVGIVGVNGVFAWSRRPGRD